MRTYRLSGSILFTLLGAVAGGLLATPALGQTPAPGAAAPSAPDAGKAKDIVTFRNGRTVEGEILEQAADTIRMRITVAGITTETTYKRADILSIERTGAAPDAGAPVASKSADGAGAPAGATNGAADQPALDPNLPKVYFLTLKGTFGEAVSETPIKRALEDAASFDPDAVVIRIDSKQDERVGFNGLFRGERIFPVFEDAARKGMRIVFWVKSAQVGAAFLPFVSREIYFTADGRMGGVGTLQDFSIGDKRVDEKQISLRLGHAEGLAIQTGYAPELIRAMARQDYWLLVRFEGGKPIYLIKDKVAPTPEELAAGWEVLSDDGEGDNEDTMEDEVRGKGNDVLNLNADWARRLGVAKGVADSLDDVVFQMGLGSQFQKIEGKGQRIVDDWATRVRESKDNIRRLRDREQNLVKREDEEDEAFLGRKMQALRELRAVMSTYAEVFDSGGDARNQIDDRIEEYRKAIQDIVKQKKETPRR